MNASVLTSFFLSVTIFGNSSCREATSRRAASDTTASAARTSMDLNRAPDIIGTITIMDSSAEQPLVWVEADPSDPGVNGRMTRKAEISNFFHVNGREGARIGCIVRVWYDESMPVLDRYPEIAVAESVALDRCK